MTEPGTPDEQIVKQPILEQLGITHKFERTYSLSPNTTCTDFISLPGLSVHGTQNICYINIKHTYPNQRIEYTSLLFARTQDAFVPVGHLDYFVPAPIYSADKRLSAVAGLINNITQAIQKTGSPLPKWLSKTLAIFDANKALIDAMNVLDSYHGLQLRGIGLGKILILLSLAQAEADGYSKLTLGLVKDEAKGFYDKLGAKREIRYREARKPTTVEETYLDTHLEVDKTSLISNAFQLDTKPPLK